ncbi:MAG: penicillin-binding protein 2, partial [Alphaproteobacteria bacterium]|nr:penicillin-binding protein 2 [Alphaproteobacteria bacterium]
PLRPLARIISAREKGENPDLIVAENIRQRHENMRDHDRVRAESRLLVLSLAFLAAFVVVGGRMGVLASRSPQEPVVDSGASTIYAQRADIVDRNGAILATNLVTDSLYAQPPLMVDRGRAAEELGRIFPDLDPKKLLKDFNSKRKFIWLRQKISPEQQQQVHDIGDPGLLFGPREMRLYPNGNLAAHVLGGARFGREGVHSAEIVGVAGVEYEFDKFLRDPANQGAPLQLSIDLTVQAAIRRVLSGGMKLFNAKGAAAILMDVKTGEVISLVSLPDFDPNARPRPLVKGKASDSPLFNRASQGLYELGSTFKVFTAANALETKTFTPDTMVATQGPLKWGKFVIKDFHDYGKTLSLTDVIVKSSNIGAANIATKVGGGRQQAFLDSLGLFDPIKFELPASRKVRPLLPPKWSELSTMTVAYGHGIAVTPLHLATAYASLLNGGTKVVPTLLKVSSPPKPGPRVVRPEVSRQLLDILRQVVVRGTASMGNVPGYEVGGKTGTANKPDPQGGYYEDKVISTFASVFPTRDPKYVLTVTYDEPEETSGVKPRRTAGWTAVPVAAEIIRRVAPLLGMRPVIDPKAKMAYTLSKY